LSFPERAVTSGRMSFRRPAVLLTTAALVLAALAGLVLRLYRLAEQPLLADELHAVRAVLDLDLETILTTYLVADHGIPLAALYEWRVESGGPLTEAFMRLPVVASGVLLLLAVPLAVGRWLGWDRAVVVAWLLALSPSLALYSRIARPYAPAVLFGTLAVFAFHAWWTSRRHRWAAAYVAAAAAGFWCGPYTAPFLGAPFLFAALRKPFAPRRGPGLVAIAIVGIAAAAALAGVVAPAWDSFFAMTEDKSGTGNANWASLAQTLELQAGSGHRAVAAAVWAAALAGLVSLARRRPDFAVLTAVAWLAQVAALWVTEPMGLAAPIVWNRYLLVGLPVALVWVAEALALAASRRPPGVPRWAPAAVIAALVAGLALAGPFTDPVFRYGSFLHNDDILGFHRPPAFLPEGIPTPYERIAAEGGAVVELTGLPTWPTENYLAVYQRRHRQRVLLAPAELGLFEGGVELRNHVEPVPRAILAAPARWLAVHLHPVGEIERLRYREYPYGTPPAPLVLRQLGRRQGRRAARYFERAWGKPDLGDPAVWVWDLDRLRAARRSRPETEGRTVHEAELGPTGLR